MQFATINALQFGILGTQLIPDLIKTVSYSAENKIIMTLGYYFLNCHMAQAKSELIRCKICGKVLYARGLHSHKRHMHPMSTQGISKVVSSESEYIPTNNFLHELDAHVAAGKNFMRTYYGLSVAGIMGNRNGKK